MDSRSSFIGFQRQVLVLPGIEVMLVEQTVAATAAALVVCPDEGMILVGCVRGSCEVVGCGKNRRFGSGAVFAVGAGPADASNASMRLLIGPGFKGTVISYTRLGIVRQTRRVLANFDVDPTRLARYAALRWWLVEDVRTLSVKGELFEMSSHDFRETGEGYFRLKTIEALHELVAPIAEGSGAAPAADRRVAHEDIAYRAQQVLARDLSHRKTANELASDCGVSPTLLKQAFRETFGVSIYQWYRAFRVHAAADALASDDMSVTEAAIAVGYSNPSKFAHAFREVMGVSPSMWRKCRRAV